MLIDPARLQYRSAPVPKRAHAGVRAGVAATRLIGRNAARPLHVQSAASSGNGSQAPSAAPLSPFGGATVTVATPEAAAPEGQRGGANCAPARPWSLHSWTWRGHKINYAVSPCLW